MSESLKVSLILTDQLGKVLEMLPHLKTNVNIFKRLTWVILIARKKGMALTRKGENGFNRDSGTQIQTKSKLLKKESKYLLGPCFK